MQTKEDLFIPESLLQEIEQVAIDTDRSLDSVVRVALRNYLASRYPARSTFYPRSLEDALNDV